MELVFDGTGDPFEAFFCREESDSERYLVAGPDDFRDCRHVVSREGQTLGRLLATFGREETGQGEEMPQPDGDANPLASAAAGPTESRMAVADSSVEEIDDSDMVVIEEDSHDAAGDAPATVFTVRPSDYRSLFTRLRRGR